MIRNNKKRTKAFCGYRRTTGCCRCFCIHRSKQCRFCPPCRPTEQTLYLCANRHRTAGFCCARKRTSSNSYPPPPLPRRGFSAQPRVVRSLFLICLPMVSENPHHNGRHISRCWQRDPVYIAADAATFSRRAALTVQDATGSEGRSLKSSPMQHWRHRRPSGGQATTPAP